MENVFTGYIFSLRDKALKSKLFLILTIAVFLAVGFFAQNAFAVVEPILTSIAKTTPASKLIYTVGDSLDITGLVVTGTYTCVIVNEEGDESYPNCIVNEEGDETNKTYEVEKITTANISGFDSSAPVVGKVLTITVGGKTATYTIDVVAPFSSAKDITSFSFPDGAGVITGADIAVTVPYGTNVTVLVPTIIITGASVNPASGVAQDFTSPVTYTVTAADSSNKVYTVTVTVAAAPIVVAAPTGGGGGGVVAGGNTPVVTPLEGTVLGAATYNFAHQFGFGSRGDDVTELQKRLTAEGFFSGPITGYFGPLTQEAVRKYQASHKITPTSGFVGPLTLAELNKGAMPGISGLSQEAIMQKLNQTITQMINILQQIIQLKSQLASL